MVSAAKLRKAQDNITQLRPFARKLRQMLYDMSNNLEMLENNKYVQERELERAAIIVITSNKGLCGAFNANVIKKTLQLLNDNYGELKSQKRLDLITIGKKGSEFFRSKGFNVIESHDEVLDNLRYDEVVPLIKRYTKLYLDRHYDRIVIVYNHFKNAAIQELRSEQLLPLKPAIIEEEEQKNTFHYIYEPSEKEIVMELVPKVIRINFYKALLDSFASEHGARMTAMHKATDNATELIKDLKLDYNKARQASITTEILEIVGGAEALKG